MPPPSVPTNKNFLGLLVKGPIALYASSMVAAFGAFAYSNRVGATIGIGMSVETLSTAVTIFLGILAATTGVIVSFLFVTNQAAEGQTKAIKQVNSPMPMAKRASKKSPKAS